MLTDSHQRIASYLRLGVTDRCNLRCRYCMPAEGIDFADRSDLLTFEEIARLARIFRSLGVDKVRLTGGEPFVRKEIDVLLEALSQIFPKVHITTNATLIHKHMPLLQRLGVAGLNISIDSLDPNRFFMITRRDDFQIVSDNIKLAAASNIPVKLNIVVMKGVNDMEITDFVQYGMDLGVTVRFIEAMPFNDDDGNRDVFLSAADIADRVRTVYSTLTKEQTLHSDSADTYMIGDYKIGIIPAYSRTLCSSCNRIRLTPQGELLTCLYAQTGLSLLQLVRDPKETDATIAEEIVNAVAQKKKSGYEEEALHSGQAYRSMTTIGG